MIPIRTSPAETLHTILTADSRDLAALENESVDLVVTSPPYPMIGMWDGLFSELSPDAGKALGREAGDEAFELMHRELDMVWRHLFRVAKPGAFVCINIGDATRTVGGRFRLYSNHSRIITFCRGIGFTTLPVILWRKQTNAPNKFMGSGMLPAGAYVTLEHEYILIFRKGDKRDFSDAEGKKHRMESAFFWEERNTWFSDVWDFKGTSQDLKGRALRSRSAAYPFELAYRLVNMYSLAGDLVLDPFWGTGTTTAAAMACGRNSIGVEIDENFRNHFFHDLDAMAAPANRTLARRMESHNDFIRDYSERKGPPRYVNENHGFPVVTRQEVKMLLREISGVYKMSDQSFRVEYTPC